MRRILLLWMCIFTLSASAQGQFFLKVGKSMEKVSPYKKPIAGGTAHQLEQARQVGNIKHFPIVPPCPPVRPSQVSTGSLPSPSVMTERGLEVNNRIKEDVALSPIEKSELTNETIPANTANDKQVEAERRFNTIIMVVYAFIGLLSFCVIGILIASFFEKRRNKTSTNIIWNDSNAPARHDKGGCVYLPQGAGVLVRN